MPKEDASIPFYLMPVAAVLAMYALLATCRALYLVYVNLKRPSPTTPTATSVPPVSLSSSPFYMLVLSIGVAILVYAKVVAIIDKAMQVAEMALFDPYEILGLSESQANSNRTLVQQQYRQLVKQHHPDKVGGDGKMFHRIHLAYKTLTDETARQQYEMYGHPDGQFHAPTLEFALPPWLLRPTGMTAITLVVLYFAMFVGIIVWVVSFLRKEEEKNVQTLQTTMTVALGDAKHFAKVLSPDSTHMDVLLAVASTPENIEWALQLYDREEKMRRERLAQIKKSTSKSPGGKSATFDLDQAGWADEADNKEGGKEGDDDDDDDDDDDEHTKEAEEKSKQAELEKAKARKELEFATGKAVVLMEGIDEGVIGQAWVEKVLTNKGQWPPTELRFLAHQKFEYKGKPCSSALEHPGVRRNLCITIGRLNSQTLNTHHELLEAGATQKVDQSYFRSALEYRQRAGILLEAALRLAISLKSYQLTATIIEAVTMFRLGVQSVNEEQIKEYESMTRKQHLAALGDDEATRDLQYLPRLQVLEKAIETPGEDEIATGDLVSLELSLERLHAEGFTRQKMAALQKQGLPPQLALAQYIEGWWVLVRAVPLLLDDDNNKNNINAEEEDRPKTKIDHNPITETLDQEDIDKFESQPERQRLYTAWPMLVQNIAQKLGKAKVQFKAPSLPGKYQILVSLKSQDFIGADQEFAMEATIVDAASVERKDEEEGEEHVDDDEEEGNDDEEPKKDK